MISKLTRLAIAAALMTSLSGCIMYIGNGEKGDFHHHKDKDRHGKTYDEKPADEVKKTAT